MCARYEPVTEPERFRKVFGTLLPDHAAQKSALSGTGPSAGKALEVFPGRWAPVVRATPQGLMDGLITASDDEPAGHEAVWAMSGLVPSWAKDTKICRSTYNARSETVAEKPSFRSAWAKHRHCIIPAEAITEPDYRSGKAVPTRIACADGLPMGIAGLWSEWDGPKGQRITSFTMLTINATEHAVMNQFHKPEDEKRMVVILPRGAWKDWLLATAERTPPNERLAMLRAYPAGRLVARSMNLVS
jgi:putative SOS response-associated peptidase YedK